MATLVVTEPVDANYETLDDALDNAGPGDTISIEGAWTNPDTVEADTSDINLIITADSTADNNGVESGNIYRLEGSGDHALTVNNTGCTIEKIIIKQVGNGNSDEGIRLTSGTTTTIKDVIVRATTQTEAQDGIYAGDWAATVNCINVAITNFGRIGFHAQNYQGAASQTWNLLSCVGLYNGNVSDYSGGVGSDNEDTTGTTTINCFNCIMLENDSGSDAADFTDPNGQIVFDIHYCIDSDNSIAAKDGGAVGCIASATVAEADQGVGNYVIFNDIDAPFDLRLTDLGNTKNVAQDMHAVDTGAGMDVSATNDIVGTSRPQNTNYDCGVFEIEVGATYTKLTDIDAILRAARTKGLDLDAILLAIQTYTKTLDLDALLKFIKTEDVDLAADIYDMLGWAWGQSNTSYVEIPEVWATWKEVGGAPATYNAEFGLLQLKSGETFYSDVKDIGSSTDRLLTIDIDKYGSGSGTQGTIEWRGSTTSFVWDAGSPSWNVYPAGGSIENWRYVQVRVTG